MVCPTSSHRKSWTPTLPAWKPICAKRQRNLNLKKPPSCVTRCATCAQKSFYLLERGNCVQVQPSRQRHEFFVSAAPAQAGKARGLYSFRHAVFEIRFVIEHNFNLGQFFIWQHKRLYAWIGSTFGRQSAFLAQTDWRQSFLVYKHVYLHNHPVANP